MEVYFIRHGQSEANLAKIMSTSPKNSAPLTKKGKRQAKRAAKKLKKLNVDKIFTSQLTRAKETTDIINEYHNASIKIDKRLNEIVTGFDGLPSKEWEQFIKKNRFTVKKKGAESMKDVQKRLKSFLKDLEKTKHKRVFIVAHGIILIMAISIFRKMNGQETNLIKTPKNCAILKFEL